MQGVYGNDMNRHSVNYNVDANAMENFSHEVQLGIFRKMAKLRRFEDQVVKVSNTGKIKVKVHMSSGQEAVGAAIAQVAADYQIFTQHRSMDTFLALGGNPEKLRDEILCLDTGCCGGRIGGAFQIHEHGIDMYAHTGLIGENVSVGVGMAFGNGRKTLCLFGDGAAEEDYVLEAFGFAATHKLPVLFVCTDNELSVLSPKKKRRSWELTDVCKGFGIAAVDLADDPFTVMYHIKNFENKLPALINVRVCRNYWHAGTGIDNPPAWDRYELLKSALIAQGYGEQIEAIEDECSVQMEDLWQKYL